MLYVFTEFNVLFVPLLVLILFQTVFMEVVNLQFEKINLSKALMPVYLFSKSEYRYKTNT